MLVDRIAASLLQVFPRSGSHEDEILSVNALSSAFLSESTDGDEPDRSRFKTVLNVRIARLSDLLAT